MLCRDGDTHISNVVVPMANLLFYPPLPAKEWDRPTSSALISPAAGKVYGHQHLLPSRTINAVAVVVVAFDSKSAADQLSGNPYVKCVMAVVGVGLLEIVKKFPDKSNTIHGTLIANVNRLTCSKTLASPAYLNICTRACLLSDESALLPRGKDGWGWNMYTGVVVQFSRRAESNFHIHTCIFMYPRYVRFPPVSQEYRPFTYLLLTYTPHLPQVGIGCWMLQLKSSGSCVCVFACTKVTWRGNFHLGCESC